MTMYGYCWELLKISFRDPNNPCTMYASKMSELSSSAYLIQMVLKIDIDRFQTNPTPFWPQNGLKTAKGEKIRFFAYWNFTSGFNIEMHILSS